MQKTNLKKSWAFWLLLAMVAVYFGLICCINLFAPPEFFDSDMYTDMRYAEEMWKHKSLFPEGWVFGNQLYVVSTPVVAGLFYGLTGNLPLAMGLASTAMAALVLLSFDWMLRPVVLGREGRMAGILVFLWVVLFYGDAVYNTSGWQLLFTMCSYYACYVLCAFLAFGCYLRCDRLSVRKNQVVLLAICFLSFGLGVQSLRQTAVMTLPLICVECLRVLHNVLRKKEQRQKAFSPASFVVALISASNLAGLAAARYLRVARLNVLEKTEFTPLQDLFDHLIRSIELMLSLIVDRGRVRFLITAALLLLFAAAVASIIIYTKKCKNTKALVLFTLLLFGVLAVAAMDVLTTMKIRDIYYFMMFPLLAFSIAWIYPEKAGWKKMALMVFLAGIFAFSWLLRGYRPLDAIRHRREGTAYLASEFMEERGFTTIYSAWDGCQDIAIASQGRITAGFWGEPFEPFRCVKYLCNPEVFYADSETCVYCFYGNEYIDEAVQRAKSKGIEMILVWTSDDGDVSLYTASENIMAAFG